jgi:outer membrane immunogenic protein
MKHLVLATTFLVAAGMMAPAFAADMPLKAAPMPVASFDWSGIYIGGHIGGGWATNDISDPGLGFIGLLIGVPPIQTTDSSGFLGGGQVGSNYQIGKLVIGWEGDVSWSQINGTSTSTFAPLGGLGGGTISRALASNTDWTATLATRIGIAHDHALFYGKAGTAIAHTNYTDTWTGNPGGPLFSGTGGQTREGWMTGVGIEYAFTNSLSFKAEYDYMNFGTRTVTVSGGGTSFGLENNLQINAVKAGLNFRVTPNIW